MESINKYTDLIINTFDKVLEENNKLKEDMKELITTHQNKCDELTQIENKYDKENKDHKEELTRLTKISLIQQYDKQLKEKTEYIKILESQLEKYKNTLNLLSPKIIKNIDSEDNLDEDSQEKPDILLNKKKKKEKKNKPEPGEKVKTFSSARLSEKSKDFLDNEPYQAKLDKLNSSSTMMNEPASFESLDSKSSMLLNNLSETQIINEPEPEILEAVNYVGIYQKKKINHMELIIENKEEIKDDKEEIKVDKEEIKDDKEEIKDDKEEIKVDKEEIKVDKTKKKKKNQEINTVFNIDMFEEINGYELIEYKGDYYLRDLETNELYNIKNNQPNKVIGLINSKSKVKFN
jgi:hypothetical protein